MRSFLRLSFCCALVLFAMQLRAQDKHIMLFETFTNSFEGCTANNDFDAAFRNTLAQPIGDQLIHLNHHLGNVGDPMTSSDATSEMLRLSEQTSYPLPARCADVDHTKFTFTGVRLTGTIPGCVNEWTARMNERESNAPPVRITLIDAKIDKKGSAEHYRVISTVQVEALENITSPMSIYYAIIEDNIFYTQCPDDKPAGPKVHNSVVRYMRTTGDDLKLNGKPAGTKVLMTYQQDISKNKSYDFKLPNMQAIAFVEKGTASTYEVVQAARLKKGLDTLQAPAKALSLYEGNLNGITYHPDDNITIVFDKTSIDSVKLEYSTNNGGSWITIGNTDRSPFYWVAPTVVTSQGKIRVSDLETSNPVATQTGSFSILGKDHDIKVLHPNGKDTAYIGKPFSIQWTKTGLDSVNIDYSNNGGLNWQIVAKNKTTTSHSWYPTAPQTEQGLIRISWTIGSGELIGASSDPFHVLQASSGSVKERKEGTEFDIRVYPQPARISGSINVEVTLPREAELTIKMYDLLGKEVYARSATHTSSGRSVVSLPATSLTAGTYVMEIVDSRGGRITQRIELF